MSDAGPLGINPLYFTLALFGCLLSFVVFLLLPRGFRVHYFASYPKRYAWSAKPRRLRRANGSTSTSNDGVTTTSSAASAGPSTTSSTFGFFGRKQTVQPIGDIIAGNGNRGTSESIYSNRRSAAGMEETVDFEAQHNMSTHSNVASATSHSTSDEAIVANAMAQLRNQGVVIVAHGSRGKPKTVRLQLTDDSITWRTETRRKNVSGQNNNGKEVKLGKLHSVALTNIMYVDVGKQTTALRRQENASVPESLCFSLLTKEGSLDLEANSPRERDALVGSFSLVLDNVHAQNWRDIYRASNDIPSSFDEYDEEGTGAPR
jgi:hypothetical protein